MLKLQVSPKVVFSEDEIQRLTTRIQDAGTVVLDVKAGDGSATLSAVSAQQQLGFIHFCCYVL